MLNKLFLKLETILLLIIIAVFIVIKIPYLSLPYYWDEAWVYGSAIRIMEANKLSLLPNAIPIYYSRGHPLLFHFLGATWLRIFGTSLTDSHAYALTISVILIVSIYMFAKNIFSGNVGIIACIFLLFQPIFQSQSVLVLPEIMLSLFALLTIYFFIKEKWSWYIFAGTLTLFTKETGIVSIASVALWQLIDSFILKKNELAFKKVVKQFAIISSPLLAITIFFIIQKNMHGWYFFSEHIDFISHDFQTFFNRLESFSAQLFVYWGKNLLTVGIIFSLFYLIYLKKQLNKQHSTALLILSIYLVLFLIASSFNFYSDRYVMSMVVVLCIITAALLETVLTKKTLLYLFVGSYVVVQLFVYLPQKTSSDHNLGYVNCVKVQQQMINYCIENNLMGKNIFTHFLMMDNLINPYCGYINNDQRFTSVSSTYNATTELYLFNNMEGKEDYEKLKNSGELTLIKRFDSAHAWSELYKRTTEK